MVAVNRRLYEQSAYDCQRCGAPEDDNMRKRVADFVRPICDACVQVMRHEGHGSDEVVVVGTSTTGLDPMTGRNTIEHHDKQIRYADWEFKCRTCFPL